MNVTDMLIDALKSRITHLEAALAGQVRVAGPADGGHAPPEPSGLQQEVNRLRLREDLLASDECWLGEDRQLLLSLNDTFAFATADAEPITDAELATVHGIWQSLGRAGLVAWAERKRGALMFPPIKEPFRSQLIAARAELNRVTVGGHAAPEEPELVLCVECHEQPDSEFSSRNPPLTICHNCWVALQPPPPRGDL